MLFKFSAKVKQGQIPRHMVAQGKAPEVVKEPRASLNPGLCVISSHFYNLQGRLLPTHRSMSFILHQKHSKGEALTCSQRQVSTVASCPKEEGKGKVFPGHTTLPLWCLFFLEAIKTFGGSVAQMV